ncbi:TetR/AcrR family transcriptional regulator [Sulfurovum mangrovi]|uniref:TetR/AcrR family transcriptional regulator n=1 Tax=Sulfurovum mangrovi TaxID=2893889 RepID=UPI001E29EA88|nr:TetR/AcrR family transcriptional regulator [Sulfurovum mangrovi]UFH59477.1 TetR/AcrR family transcriptional regulator [Sulfurovum mangrovi]
MKTSKKKMTKEKIKEVAIELFNREETLSVTTNHIAKEAGISPGNLYYHYKNKEEILIEIYQEMSDTFVGYNSFTRIIQSDNPLKELSKMFDLYGELFWHYRFLMRDATVLMAIYPRLKSIFSERQEKRIKQIESLLHYLLEQHILERIPAEEISLRAKLHWFISTYWQTFITTGSEITKHSIKEAKVVIFKLQLYPYLSEKGKEMWEEIEDIR